MLPLPFTSWIRWSGQTLFPANAGADSWSLLLFGGTVLICHLRHRTASPIPITAKITPYFYRYSR